LLKLLFFQNNPSPLFPRLLNPEEMGGEVLTQRKKRGI
jgi:hypothetical protein